MNLSVEAVPCSPDLLTPSRSGARQVVLILVLFAGFGGLNPVLLGSRSNDSSAAQAFWLGAAVMSVLGARKHLHSARYFMRAVGLYAVAFGMLAVISSYWSIFPTATFRQSVALCLSILTGFCIGVNTSTYNYLSAIAKSCFFVSILSLGGLLAGVSSSRGIDGSFIGILTHRNSLASVAGVGLICSATHQNKKSLKTLIVCVVFIATIVLTASRTTELSFILSIFAVWCITLASKHRTGGVGVVILMAGTVAGLFWSAGGPGSLLRLVGRDSTLTGRTDLWTLVVSFIKMRPWIGWGFGVTWRDDSPIFSVTRLLFPELRSAHNSVLEVWLALGFFGVSLASIWFLRSFWAVYWVYFTTRSKSDRVCLTLLTFLAFRFVTEAGFPTQNSAYLFIVVGIPLVVAPPRLTRHSKVQVRETR